MTINKMKLFSFKDMWPWLLGLLIVTGAIGQAIRYNYFQTHDKIGWPGWVAFAVILVAYYGITTWRYILRYQFMEKIIGYTQDGTGVTLAPGILDQARDAFPKVPYALLGNALLTFINQTQESVLSFWNDWASKNNCSQLTISIFNGNWLAIENKPFVVVGVMGKLAGLENLGIIAVMWQNFNLTALGNIISHETGHLCLDCLGFEKLSSDQQHQIFTQAGFNY